MFRISMAAIILIVAGAVTAVAVPMSVLDQDDPTINAGGGVHESKALGEGGGSLLAMGGDTVLVVCSLNVFQWGVSGGSDCWGWTAPDGTDYAIMGVNTGIVIYNISTGQIADFVDGPISSCGGIYWRDMETYDHYLYCVSECIGTNQGIMVVDLQYLPDSVSYLHSVASVGDVTSHNLAVDSTGGFLYTVRSSYDGFRIFRLDNPEFPSEIPSVFTPDIHDMYGRNDTVWVAEAYARSFSVWDLTDEANPQLITRVNVPNGGYVHNIWPTEDGNYVVTTEETAFKTVKIWDTHDLLNVTLVDEYLGSSNLAHNAQVKNGRIYLSHYESGMRIVNMKDPLNVYEEAGFDTYLAGETPNFNGAWGCYPYSPNGKIYASNLDGHLFAFQEQEVVINDSLSINDTQAPSGASVQLEISIKNDFSGRRFVLPFSWGGPYGLSLDSVSVSGLRTAGFEIDTAAYSLATRQIAVTLTAPAGTFLDPGTGPILRLHLTIPDGVFGPPNTIEFITFNGYDPEVNSECVSYQPYLESGSIEAFYTCCVVAGDINQDGVFNISDAIYVVNHVFKGGPAPTCLNAADANADCNFDIGDAVAIINHVFKGGPAPQCSLCI